MNTTTVGGVKITFFGHASISLEGNGVLVAIDPFAPMKLHRPADVVLHTHNHFDHCDEEKTEKVSKFNTVLIGTNCRHPCRLLKIKESVRVGGVGILAVPAYNVGKQYHERDANCAGYILAFGSTRIYVAGDTDEIPEMEKYKCDVALLPIGGTFTMDAAAAARACAKINPRIVIPVHYGYLGETKGDAILFKQLVERETGGKTEVRVLTPA